MGTDRRLRIPLFPLGTVLFPGGVMPLRIFEMRYLEMVRACLKDGGSFGVCLIQDGQEVGAPAIPADVGCLARIVDWEMPQPDLYHIVVHGSDRFRLLDARAGDHGLLHGEIVLLDPEPRIAVPDRYAMCVEILRQIAMRCDESQFPRPHVFDDASWVGYRLAELLPLDPFEKQRMLVANDPVARLERVLHLLKRG